MRGRDICRHVPSQKSELPVNPGAGAGAGAGQLVRAALSLATMDTAEGVATSASS